MVGDLAAAVDLYHGDIAAGQQVLGFAGHALSEHGRMFHHPKLVFRALVAGVGEGFHGVENRAVFGQAERDDFHHSTTFTIGCEVSAR